ncbi:MAG: hypothetical protein K9H16_03270 [Bacteroidales bacterium]|nr:hypothetical protein [Bacteroidales bacterium]
MDTENLKLLKESFDRDLSPGENELLSNALLNDPELKAEAGILQRLRNLVGETSYTFSPFFTEKVLNRIEMQDDRNLEFAFFRIALPGLAAAAVLLLITFLAGNSFSFDSLLGVNSLQPEYLTDFLIYTH